MLNLEFTVQRVSSSFCLCCIFIKINAIVFYILLSNAIHFNCGVSVQLLFEVTVYSLSCKITICMLIEPISTSLYLVAFILEAIHNWRAAFRNEKGQRVFSELMRL